MAYKLLSTKRADELLDSLIFYLAVHLQNREAAAKLLDGYAKLYDRMTDNPFQFPLSSEVYFSKLGIHYALVSGMNYMLLFEIQNEDVVILGYYHQSENYPEKLKDDISSELL